MVTVTYIFLYGMNYKNTLRANNAKLNIAMSQYISGKIHKLKSNVFWGI